MSYSADMRKASASKTTISVALMAAATKAYPCGRIPGMMLWSVFKLHATDDPRQRLELTRHDQEALESCALWPRDVRPCVSSNW
jgi:hypothetical protein